MKSFNGKLALAVAAAALLTTAAYAQTPSDAAVHHGIHHARHAYHTGTAHAAAIHNQAAANDASNASNGAGGNVSPAQPLYDVYNAAVVPTIAQPGVACVGGVGHGYYPNPGAYGDSAATIQNGSEFTLERGYPGCFAVGE
jgi:hypothetical protein